MRIMPHAKEIYEAVKKLKERYELVLPPPANKCLDDFIKDDNFNKLLSTTELMTAGSQSIDVQARLTLLASLQSELTYHLPDFSAVAKRLSERAFLHLQRSIMADSSVKQRWIEAFENGEVACEKLGGAHLLLHGIWAFKVSAEGGGCTDLVLQEPLIDLIEVESAAEALVLTEWKTVRRGSEQESKAKEARLQVSIYASGVLGGTELRQYRYLVLVSKNWLRKTPDIQEGDTVYRHVNIAVDPQSPSEAARTNKRSSV